MQKEKIIEWIAEGSISIPKLLMNNYAKLGLDEQEFVLLLHVYTFISSGKPFPTPNELSNRMSISSTVCMEKLRLLMRRGFINIEDSSEENGIFSESYSLKPLWEKITFLILDEEKRNEEEEVKELETNLYNMFEKEFGRPLSPMEGESLSLWLDEDAHSPTVIKAALREAVLSGKLNFRYIDRILFEWKKNGVQTAEQAKAYSQKFRKSNGKTQSLKSNSNEENTSIPFYNWLES